MQPEEIYTDSDEDASMISDQAYTQETLKKTSLDQSMLCRLCAIGKDEMIPIFGENGNETEISRKILDCFSFNVRKNDIVEKICQSCLAELRKFHEYRQNIIKTLQLNDQTNEKPFRCDICGKSYMIKLELDDHRKIHTKERPYKCPTCEKVFPNTARLREHKRLHTGERHYKCKFCDKTFKRSNSRKDHMAVHTGENKHYKCFCGGTFKRMGDLKKHKKTMHIPNA